MADNVRLKDKKIVIYKKVIIYNTHGFRSEGYMPIYDPEVVPNLWAYFKQLSADLLYKNNTTSTKEDCFFRVNRSHYLRNADATDLVIEYNDRVYQITRIDPYEDYNRDLSLYAKVTDGKIDDIIPYNPDLL